MDEKAEEALADIQPPISSRPAENVGVPADVEVADEKIGDTTPGEQTADQGVDPIQAAEVDREPMQDPSENEHAERIKGYLRSAKYRVIAEYQVLNNLIDGVINEATDSVHQPTIDQVYGELMMALRAAPHQEAVRQPNLRKRTGSGRQKHWRYVYARTPRIFTRISQAN